MCTIEMNRQSSATLPLESNSTLHRRTAWERRKDMRKNESLWIDFDVETLISKAGAVERGLLLLLCASAFATGTIVYSNGPDPGDIGVLAGI